MQIENFQSLVYTTSIRDDDAVVIGHGPNQMPMRTSITDLMAKVTSNVDTLAEVLVNGSNTGGTSITVDTGDEIQLGSIAGNTLRFISGTSTVDLRADTLNNLNLQAGVNATLTAGGIVTINGVDVDSTGALSKITGLDYALSATDNITVDGSTNQRNITLGAIRHLHTPAIAGTRAIDFQVDANGFGDTKAIEVSYKATSFTATDTGVVFNIIADRPTGATGEVSGLRVQALGAGTTDIRAIHADVEVDPIHQHSGTLGAIETAFTYDGSYTDVTANFNSTATDSTMFAADNDEVIIGMAAQFSDIQFILATQASGAGIKPTFEYSDGIGGWTSFSPVDGTNGMRQNGSITFSPSNLTGWAQDTVNAVSGKYWIRITRTQNALTTPPVEDIVEVSSFVEYFWNKSGDISVATGDFTGKVTVQDQLCVGVASPVATSYELSVQDTDSDVWIELLNGGGTGQGAFFGLAGTGGAGDEFSLFNYQGGGIGFYAHPSVSNSNLIVHMSNRGNLELGGHFNSSGAGTPTAVLSIQSGTAPTGSVANVAQIYTADWNGAGTATLHARNEEGNTFIFTGSAAYTRNATIVEDRTLLASASATATNNNNVLAALIADLQQQNIIG